jgi:uncharacterized membrane protein YhhN
VHTSLGDHLVALRRPAALAALAAAAGGAVAALAPQLRLWRLTAQVQALDTVDVQEVTALRGAATSDLTWGLAGIGVVVVGLAVLVAVDRPPPAAERLLVAAGLLVLAGTTALLVDRPATSAFTGGAATELVAGDVPLPTGVDIALEVQPTTGFWVLYVAGLLMIAGTLVALRRG